MADIEYDVTGADNRKFIIRQDGAKIYIEEVAGIKHIANAAEDPKLDTENPTSSELGGIKFDSKTELQTKTKPNMNCAGTELDVGKPTQSKPSFQKLVAVKLATVTPMHARPYSQKPVTGGFNMPEPIQTKVGMRGVRFVTLNMMNIKKNDYDVETTLNTVNEEPIPKAPKIPLNWRPKKKKISAVKSCCIPGCFTNSAMHKDINIYRVPCEGKNFSNEKNEWTAEFQKVFPSPFISH